MQQRSEGKAAAAKRTAVRNRLVSEQIQHDTEQHTQGTSRSVDVSSGRAGVLLGLDVLVQPGQACRVATPSSSDART